MKRWLLHPRTTLVALTSGLWAFGTGIVATIIALRPLELLAALVVSSLIVKVDVALAVVAVASLILCALGRSILPFVDNDKP